MGCDQIAKFEAALIGRTCAVSRRENDWTLAFSGDVDLTVTASWRIVSQGRIAFARDDEGHLFGRASPLEGEAELARLLRNRTLTKATVDRQTADLVLHFGADTRIDVFNDSSGYEAWQARYDIDGQHRLLIAMGGGQVTFVVE